MDALLPLVAQGAEPPPDFRARVMAAAESAGAGKRGRFWGAAALVGATAAVAAGLVIGFAQRRKEVRTARETELAAAEKLAAWRAPSDVLLKTPGREFLQRVPKLGDSYLHLPAQTPGRQPERAMEED